MLFHYIDDQVPEATTRLMRAAAVSRGLEICVIDAAHFDFDADRQARPGDLLYRPAVSLRAMHAEQFICTAQTATFYQQADGVFFHGGGLWMHRQSGLPVPRFFPCYSADRSRLREYAEAVGGFPVILKVPGNSRGIGVMRIDSLSGLFSVVDFALSTGRTPLLMSCIDDAEHWRVVVIGDRAAAAYRNPTEPDDFRTYGSRDLADFTDQVPDDLARLAVRSVQVQRLEFGGVDILRHASGRLYLLESNFPCYHAHAQEVAGYDLSGQMLDHLIAKAKRLVPDQGVGRPVVIDVALQLPAETPAERATRARVETLAETPSVFQVDDFLTADQLADLLAHVPTHDELIARGITLRHNSTGESFEWPIQGDVLLESLARRMASYVGVHNAFNRSVRYRCYQPGESHPPHLDDYEIAGRRLVATALLYLTNVEAGGATAFPRAQPQPLQVMPKAGRLCYWVNWLDGAADPASLHEGLVVQRGTKITLAQFFYAEV